MEQYNKDTTEQKGANRPVSAEGTPVGQSQKVASTLPTLGFELRPGWNILPSEELPLPTYWPVVMALGITLLAFGLISSSLIIIAGLILFVISLIGWIGDIQDEQRHGHSH